MEAPATLDGNDIRREKIKVLQALQMITEETAATHTVRGQYTAGVVDGEAVAGFADELSESAKISGSETETFVALKTHIDNWRWAGVPIYLRTGKRMAQRWSEIVIQFKPVPVKDYPAGSLGPLASGILVDRDGHEWWDGAAT